MGIFNPAPRESDIHMYKYNKWGSVISYIAWNFKSRHTYDICKFQLKLRHAALCPYQNNINIMGKEGIVNQFQKLAGGAYQIASDQSNSASFATGCATLDDWGCR